MYQLPCIIYHLPCTRYDGSPSNGMASGDTDPHFVLHSSSHRHGRDGTCAKRHRTRRTEVPTRGASTKSRRNEAKDDVGERE